MDRFKRIKIDELERLPQESGVYLFFLGEEIGYIGKAVNIKDRVKNHFQQPTHRDNLFLKKISQIGFLQTDSEIEALILEAGLIKKYQPRFNVIWRDDKNYFYIAVTKTEKSIVYVAHQKNDKATYVGPFVEGTALKKTLRYLRKIFPFYTTKKHPKNKCLYCHLGLCPGPEPDLKEYKKNLGKMLLILKGKRSRALSSLKKEMAQLSKEKKFEDAAKVRDRIYHLQQVMNHTKVIAPQRVTDEAWGNTEKILQGILNMAKPIFKIECYDISNIQGQQATGSMVVFKKGQPDKNLYRKFKIRLEEKPNDIAMLKEVFQRRFSHSEWEYPQIILIDGGRAQLNVAIKTKNEKIETKNIKVISIAKGRQELFIENGNPPAGEPIPLKDLPQQIYNLIKHLDDEAHRFAITYHKKLRKNKLLN